jgi:imidazolonepropionase-like amidohydrolase
MPDLLLRNALLVDGEADRPRGPVDIRVADGRIAELSDRGLTAPDTVPTLDAGRRVAMPGLIDAHVHVIATTPNLGANAALPNSLVALRAARIMRDMLHRGFTTVRDLGGADIGLVEAVEAGLIEGPRL